MSIEYSIEEIFKIIHTNLKYENCFERQPRDEALASFLPCTFQVLNNKDTSIFRA